jgi:CRP-like cAMP-binding protein/predicted acylesterase/phospholipase RssA
MVPFLGSLRVFRDLPSAELNLLADGLTSVDLAAGEVLFRQGDPGDSLYVVRSGALQVVVALPTGQEHELARLESGDLVGEMALVHRQPRAATVRATAPSTVLRISAASLERLFAVSPTARSRVLEVISRRLPSLHLASVPLFAGLGADALAELDLETNWMRLAGGQTLFRQGDPADYLYVVSRGRLEVVIEGERGRPEVVRQLGRGDVVGEVAIFTGAPRNATVRAIRDAELVRLSKVDLDRFLERHPRGAIEVIRLLAARVRPVPSGRRDGAVSTIALVPVGTETLDRTLAASLIQAFRDVAGATLHVDRRCITEAFGEAASALADDADLQTRVTHWLHEQEERTALVAFDCGDLPAAWTDLFLRQTDLVVFVAPPGARAAAGERDQRIATEAIASSATKMLVLLHAPDTRQPTGTAAWLALLPVARHLHVRVDRAGDFARVARYVSGNAIGLAVSGGGARTFAHLGVMRALRDRSVPIDAVGGVSAGVFSAAYCALGYDIDETERIFLGSVENYKLLSDVTLPLTSFLSGRKLIPVLQRMFGEGLIEDLWLPFFCLAANLTTAQISVLDRGPLWRAIRATTSVPGIHPPVSLKGELLVDGGVLNNLPVDVMRRRCGGAVIASDVSLTSDLKSDAEELVTASGWPLLWARVGPFSKQPPSLPNVFEILARTATLSSVYHGGQVAKAADVYVRTPTDGVATFDWAAGTVLVNRAYALAAPALEQWQAAGWPHR